MTHPTSPPPMVLLQQLWLNTMDVDQGGQRHRCWPVCAPNGAVKETILSNQCERLAAEIWESAQRQVRGEQRKRKRSQQQDATTTIPSQWQIRNTLWVEGHPPPHPQPV